MPKATLLKRLMSDDSALPADFCRRRNMLIAEYAIMTQQAVEEFNSPHGMYHSNYVEFCNAITPKWDWLATQIIKLEREYGVK